MGELQKKMLRATKKMCKDRLEEEPKWKSSFSLSHQYTSLSILSSISLLFICLCIYKFRCLYMYTYGHKNNKFAQTWMIFVFFYFHPTCGVIIITDTKLHFIQIFVKMTGIFIIISILIKYQTINLSVDVVLSSKIVV